MRLVELQNLLLHLFVLVGCEGPLIDIVQRPRLLGLIVAKFRLKNSGKKDIQYLHMLTFWAYRNSEVQHRFPNTRWVFTCSVYEPSSAWVTNEQGSRPEATSWRSCRHNRYLPGEGVGFLSETGRKCWAYDWKERKKNLASDVHYNGIIASTAKCLDSLQHGMAHPTGSTRCTRCDGCIMVLSLQVRWFPREV